MQSEDSVDKVHGRDGLTARKPNPLDLSASVNSTDTADTGSQGDDSTPRANQGSFDYFAAATSQSAQVLTLTVSPECTCATPSLHDRFHPQTDIF